MIWIILISFLTFDGWAHRVPIYNDPPYTTREACDREAVLLQKELADQWPDDKANVKEIIVSCYISLPRGN